MRETSTSKVFGRADSPFKFGAGEEIYFVSYLLLCIRIKRLLYSFLREWERRKMQKHTCYKNKPVEIV